MRCPACSKELTEGTVGGITVDVCQGGCGGIWFDWLEIKKFDEPHEEEGTELLDLERNPAATLDRSKRLSCPKCDDTIMVRHFFSVSQFPSEAARKEAASKYFEDVFGDRLAKMRQESDEKTEKVRRIVNMFKYICPSYYIPGKQVWGAF
ncbi:MAG: zf-TFIIB domain-containing protein [Planctomycetota bacterium]|jgi:Zn-finger nucleic acid-binding protein